MPESQANVQSQTLKPTSTSSLLFQSVCLKLIKWNIDYFQSSDGRLRLFQCDFLHLTEQMVGGRVDAVWDTQSLVSINPRDRKQYVRTVKLVSTHQTYLKIIKHLLLKSMKEDRSKQLTILIPCFCSCQSVMSRNLLRKQACTKNAWPKTIYSTLLVP